MNSIFRVWDKQQNKWATVRNLVLDRIGEKKYYRIPLCDNERFVVQQFTGIKDKNYVEIYEGDIVKAKELGDWHDETLFDVVYEIKWSNFDYGWRGFTLAMSPEKYLGAKIPINTEIIGNVFENLKLLK